MSAHNLANLRPIGSPRAGEYLTYPVHSPVVLTDDNGTLVPRGYLFLADISAAHIAADSAEPTVTLALYPATYSERANTFVRAHPMVGTAFGAGALVLVSNGMQPWQPFEDDPACVDQRKRSLLVVTFLVNT